MRNRLLVIWSIKLPALLETTPYASHNPPVRARMPGHDPSPAMLGTGLFARRMGIGDRQRQDDETRA